MLEDAWNDILKADEKGRPKAIYRAAHAYDDVILSQEVISDESFDFLIKIIKSDQVANSRGIEHFLLEVNCDFEKYNRTQQDLLLKTIREFAPNYTDYMGLHTFGDLVARAYQPDCAYDFFMSLLGKSEAANTISFVGFDVLRMRLDKSNPLYKRVMLQWSKVLDDENKKRAERKPT